MHSILCQYNRFEYGYVLHHVGILNFIRIVVTLGESITCNLFLINLLCGVNTINCRKTILKNVLLFCQKRGSYIL